MFKFTAIPAEVAHNFICSYMSGISLLVLQSQKGLLHQSVSMQYWQNDVWQQEAMVNPQTAPGPIFSTTNPTRPILRLNPQFHCEKLVTRHLHDLWQNFNVISRDIFYIFCHKPLFLFVIIKICGCMNTNCFPHFKSFHFAGLQPFC